MAKKIIRKDPFEEYSDITQDVTQDVGGDEHDYELPIDPYQKKIMTKKSNSLGKVHVTFSVQGELVMRLKLLCARMNQDLQLSGSKKKVTLSKLIEDGMRHILRKKRDKYKNLP